MNIGELLNSLKGGAFTPETLALALKVIMDLSDGNARLSAETRLELQAELDKLTGGVL